VVGYLDPAKLLVILAVALIVLGPDRLPRAARQLGRAWHQLTQVRDQVIQEVKGALPDDLPRIPRTPNLSGFLSDLTRPASPDTATPSATSTATPSVAPRPAPAAAPVIEASVTFDDPSLN
jgi:sec-independent protein translocase protein TatB